MSRRVAKRGKFAEFRELRQSGKKKSYDVGEVDELYEEVDENQYKKIVRDRLNEDDFVVDDNGEGYADDGREEWDRLPQYQDDSEEELGLPGSKPRKCEQIQTQNQMMGANSKAVGFFMLIFVVLPLSQETKGTRRCETRCQRQRHHRILHERGHQSPSKSKGHQNRRR